MFRFLWLLSSLLFADISMTVSLNSEKVNVVFVITAGVEATVESLWYSLATDPVPDEPGALVVHA